MDVPAQLEGLKRAEQSVRDRFLDLGHERFETREWYRIVAALDNIGDTTIGIESFLVDQTVDADGPRYLRLFGVLQCVFTQQDSISLLSKKVGKATPSGEAWIELRDLRNRVVGHPAERGGAVARMSLETGSLMVLDWGKGEPRSRDVDLPELLGRYVCEAAEGLTLVVPRVLASILARGESCS